MDSSKLREVAAGVPKSETLQRKTWREYFAQRTRESYVPSRQTLVMLLRSGLGDASFLSDEALYCVRWLSKRTGVRMSRLVPDLILTAIPDHPVYRRYLSELMKALDEDRPVEDAVPGAGLED